MEIVHVEFCKSSKCGIFQKTLPPLVNRGIGAPKPISGYLGSLTIIPTGIALAGLPA